MSAIHLNAVRSCYLAKTIRSVGAASLALPHRHPLPGLAYVDYQKEIATTKLVRELAELDAQFKALSEQWIRTYKDVVCRETDIFQVDHSSFRFLFDCIGADDGRPENRPPPGVIARTIVAYGFSNPSIQSRKKQDQRLRGWMGPEGRRLGPHWDKGHLVAHSFGGYIDGSETNVFQQRRDLNRGWTYEGRRYRKMEQYCAQQKGVAFFHRPIYLTEGDIPQLLEFGIQLGDGRWWVEVFDNSPENRDTSG